MEIIAEKDGKVVSEKLSAEDIMKMILKPYFEIEK